MTKDITSWLEGLGLGKYAAIFAENEIDPAALPHLTDDDLKDIGVALGSRRIILASIVEFQAGKVRDDPIPSSEHGEPIPPAEAERRQLSIMFCDLVGSTELSQRLDPEDLREIMRQYQDAVAGAVSRYEGHVAKFLGDGVLAYFGWPRAYEDQAERAVHAALDAVATVSRLKVDGGDNLQARVGIATGQVVVGDIIGDKAAEMGAVVGETPILAARLQTLADPGTVIIGRNTRHLAGHVFDLNDEGEHRLKGFADPVRAWRVLGKGREKSRFEAAHGETLTGFVGRTQEMALLMDRWEQAVGGKGQCVLISGEAGIGKSRVLREFKECLDRDSRTCLRYQCSPYQVNAAFNPIIEQLQHAADFRQDDNVEDKLDKVERLLRATLEGESEDLSLMAALLALPSERYPPLNMTPQRQKLQTIALLVSQLEALSKEQSVLMLVEDIHWIDPSSLEVFDAVVDRACDLSVLVVMTHRPEFEPRWALHGHVTHHTLNRLDYGDGKAMAEHVTGGRELPEAVLKQILEHTDGVPLFVEELTKTVIEAGFLEEQNGRYILDGPLPHLAIPSTLKDSLMARLDRLSAVKEVIQAAACIGREFSPELLGSAVSIGQAALDDALIRLVDAQLVYRRSGVDGPHYLFKHALVQDAAYESLLTRKRRELHARIAEVLEASVEPDPATLAHHCSAAGLAEKAARYYLETGNRLLRASGLAEACAELEAGLREIETLPSNSARDRLELDISLVLGTARLGYFGWPHSSVPEILEPAFRLATTLRDTEALRTVLFGLWVHFMCRAEFPQALQWVEALNGAVEETDDSELTVVRDMAGGVQRLWMADYDEVTRYTQHMRTTYDVSKHSGVVRYTNHDPYCTSLTLFGANVDWIVGYPDRAIAHLDEGIALARQLNHPFNLAFALTVGSWFMAWRGDLQRIFSQCDEAEEIAEKHALEFIRLNMVHVARGMALIISRDSQEGYELLKQGWNFWSGIGGRVNNPQYEMHLAAALGDLGSSKNALDTIEGAISSCRATGERWIEPEALRTKGELLLGDQPDPDGAELAFNEAIELAREHAAKSWELRAATSLARLWQSQGKLREARQLLTPVYQWFTEGFETADLRRAHALLEDLS